MNSGLLKALNRLYKPDRMDYDSEHDCLAFTWPADVSAADQSVFAAAGIDPIEFDCLQHDQAIERFQAAAAQLDMSVLTRTFIAGVGGSCPRGRQSLMSFIYARHLPTHEFVSTIPGNPAAVCQVCGLPEVKWFQSMYERFTFWKGRVWTERPESWIYDLEETAAIRDIQPKDDDVERFSALLNAIAAAPANESPGQLEKRIAKAKLLPATGKYERLGILSVLAELGVLPNPVIRSRRDGFVRLAERLDAAQSMKGHLYSDIVLPLAAWRGELGVDRAVAQELFALAGC